MPIADTLTCWKASFNGAQTRWLRNADPARTLNLKVAVEKMKKYGKCQSPLQILWKYVHSNLALASPMLTSNVDSERSTTYARASCMGFTTQQSSA